MKKKILNQKVPHAYLKNPYVEKRVFQRKILVVRTRTTIWNISAPVGDRKTNQKKESFRIRFYTILYLG